MTFDEMKVGNGQTLPEMLEELYSWYWKLGRKAREEKRDPYRIGKIDGAIEAIESILLQVVGGQRLYELWEQEAKIQDLVDGAKAYVEEHYDGKEEEELPLE